MVSNVFELVVWFSRTYNAASELFLLFFVTVVVAFRLCSPLVQFVARRHSQVRKLLLDVTHSSLDSRAQLEMIVTKKVESNGRLHYRDGKFHQNWNTGAKPLV